MYICFSIHIEVKKIASLTILGTGFQRATKQYSIIYIVGSTTYCQDIGLAL